MKKVVIGIIIMLVGVFLLFHNLGYFPYSIYRIIISWQALLIAIGSVMLFDKKNDSKNAGVILIVIGTIFLIPKIFDVNISGILIPLLIILGGIFFVVRAVTKKDEQKSVFGRGMDGEDFNNMSFVDTSLNEQDFIKREFVFSGAKERWTYGKIKGAKIEAVFSGVELDLTQIELSEEVKSVYIKVESVFSGVTIYVPEDWNILIQKTGVFGGFADKRPLNLVKSVEGKQVIMDLEAVFGGGEIKCYE